MKYQPYSHACAKRMRCAGFTIIEFLVASTIGLIVLSLALSAALSGRSLYREDIVRTRINQNLRSAVDLITLNARQAGQSLESDFPAILLDNGTSDGQDEVVFRRNLYEREVLNLCQTLTQSSFTPTILVSNGPANANANCRYSSGWATYVSTWSTYRQANSNVLRAFAYNRTSHLGEFFLYSGETDNGTQLLIHRQSGNWVNNYTGDGVSAALYLLEQFRYRVANGVLQLVVNDDEANALNVVDGIIGFDINAEMTDGTTKTTLAVTDTWTDVAALSLTMTGVETVAGKQMSSTLTTRIFARNILSH